VDVTEPSPTLPFSPAPDPTPRKSAVPSGSGEAASPAVPPAAETGNAPKPTPPPFGLTEHFDDDMQRMILEARDPVSGYVIFQMPAKYVIKQHSAIVHPVAPRGTSINRTL
jgi:hypothetical protein